MLLEAIIITLAQGIGSGQILSQVALNKLRKRTSVSLQKCPCIAIDNLPALYLVKSASDHGLGLIHKMHIEKHTNLTKMVLHSGSAHITRASADNSR